MMTEQEFEPVVVESVLTEPAPIEKVIENPVTESDKPLLSDLITEPDTRVFLKEKSGRTYNGTFIDEVLGVIRIRAYDNTAGKYYYYGIHKKSIYGFKIFHTPGEEDEIQESMG